MDFETKICLLGVFITHCYRVLLLLSPLKEQRCFLASIWICTHRHTFLLVSSYLSVYMLRTLSLYGHVWLRSNTTVFIFFLSLICDFFLQQWQARLSLFTTCLLICSNVRNYRHIPLEQKRYWVGSSICAPFYRFSLIAFRHSTVFQVSVGKFFPFLCVSTLLFVIERSSFGTACVPVWVPAPPSPPLSWLILAIY